MIGQVIFRMEGPAEQVLTIDGLTKLLVEFYELLSDRHRGCF